MSINYTNINTHKIKIYFDLTTYIGRNFEASFFFVKLGKFFFYCIAQEILKFEFDIVSQGNLKNVESS